MNWDKCTLNLDDFINREYVRQRDQLIPEAEKWADAQNTTGDYAWNRCFFYRMDELARRAGLIP